jgi:hypothetical protein
MLPKHWQGFLQNTFAAEFSGSSHVANSEKNFLVLINCIRRQGNRRRDAGVDPDHQRHGFYPSDVGLIEHLKQQESATVVNVQEIAAPWVQTEILNSRGEKPRREPRARDGGLAQSLAYSAFSG